MSPIEFFRCLYGEKLPKNSALHFRYVVHPEKDIGTNRGQTAQTLWCTSLDTLPDFPQDAHVFFGVALRPEKKKHGVLWTALWADVDSDTLHLPHGFPEPTIIVNSGRGLHVYWALKPPLVYEAEEIRPYLRGVQRAIPGADPNAAEPERLLRVPGTHNVKHADAPLCDIIEMHSGRMYDIADFKPYLATTVPRPKAPPIQAVEVDYALFEFPKGKDWLKKAAWTGDWEAAGKRMKGITSHSHLLMAIAGVLVRAGHPDPVIKGFMKSANGLIRDWKEGERDNLLDDVIAKAHADEEDTKKAQAAGLVVHEGETYLLLDDGTRGTKVMNYEMVPTMVFDESDGQGGYFVRLKHVNGDRWQGFLRASKLDALATLAMKSFPPTFLFQGTNIHHLNAVRSYLANYPNIPRRRATWLLGWHDGRISDEYLVASNGSYTRELPSASSPWHYLGGQPWNLTLADDKTAGLLERVLHDLLQLHAPHVSQALLGWFMSCLLCPQLRRIRGKEFAGIWTWGPAQAGKTQTVGQFLRLFSRPDEFVASSGNTTVGIERLIAQSNTVPIFIDDLRKTRQTEDERGDLYRVLRNAFDERAVSRAKTDDLSQMNETVARHLRAPVIVSSEHAIERDQALEDRYLLVPFRDEGKSAASKGILERLLTLPHNEFSRLTLALYAAVWDTDVAARWHEAELLTSFLTDKGARDRPRKAVAQIVFGLRLAQQIVPSLFEMPDWSDIAERVWVRSLDGTGAVVGSTVSSSFRDIREHVWGLIRTRRIGEIHDFRVQGDRLVVIEASLKQAVTDEAAHGNWRFSPSHVFTTLRSEPRFVTFRPERFGSSSPPCVVFNLTALEAELGALDRPWETLQSQRFSLE